ncbi:hypothetical protein TNCV_1072951 [Trichonephila clavipes]|nr:hypothetical protein TNCV_1072951 [Trichonephila clavipes]
MRRYVPYRDRHSTRCGTVINKERIPSKTFCLIKYNAVIKMGALDGWSGIFQFLLKLPFPTHVTKPIEIDSDTCYTLTDKNRCKKIHELVKKREKDTEDKDLQNFKKSKSLEKHLFEDKSSTSGLHVNLSESKNSLPHPHGENEPINISSAKLIGILSILESHCDPNSSDISTNISNGKESEPITFITVDDGQDETSDPLPKLKSIDCHQENKNYPFTSVICSKSAMMKTTWNKSNNSEVSSSFFMLF